MPALDNTQIIENVLDDNDIESLLTNETILEYKKQLEQNNIVKFYFPVKTEIINKINNSFSCHLESNEIPFKWVKGDTPPHTDTCVEGNHFNTHLVYLTDNAGKLKIKDNEYNITKGCGYIFNEGLIHETINTDERFKLILGPFNTRGDMIGPPDDSDTLISLFVKISSGTLSPEFDMNIDSYTANVSYDTANVIIDTILLHSGNIYFIININGVDNFKDLNNSSTNVSLNYGDNIINLLYYRDSNFQNLIRRITITITREMPLFKGNMFKTLYSDNASVYYKCCSLSSGSGGVRNYRAKKHKT